MTKEIRMFLSRKDIHQLLLGNAIIERFISPDSDIRVRVCLEGNDEDLEEDNKNE